MKKYRILIMIVPALLITAAYWFSSARPLPYESKAIYQFVSSDHGTSLFNKNPTLPTYMTATEQTVVLSQMSLKMLSENLNLPTRWSITEEQVLDILKKSTTARTIPSTDLMELSVKLSSPEDSRDIVQGLVDVHQKRRRDKILSMANDFMKELEIAVLDQSDVVEEKRKLRDNFLRRSCINLGDNVPRSDTVETASEILTKQYSEAVASLVNIDFHINLIKHNKSEETFAFVASQESAPQELKELYSKHQNQNKLLTVMREAGDSSVAAQTKIEEDLRQQLSESVAAFQDRLRFNRDTQAAQVSAIYKQLQELKSIAVDNVILTTALHEAQERFKIEQTLLDSMREKLNAIRIESKLPQEALIMHEVPQLGRPTRPALTPLILGAIALVGLIIGFIIAFMLEYLSFTRPKLRETPSIS